MLRLLAALAVGLAVGIGTAFAMAVVLGILNLYLTGHGIRWQEQSVTYGFASLSFLDLVLLLCSGLAAFAAMAAALMATKRREE